MTRPGLLTGAWIGLLLTLPLVVISALGNQLAGLPFIPFDLFPFIRDITPGALLTLVIDSMVAAITALNLGRVDTAAKVAEQGMTILMLVGLGVIAGALFFAILKAMRSRGGPFAGLIFGLIVGVPLALISQSVGNSARTGSPALNMLWIVLLFAVWGVLHSWAYDRLTLPEMNARGQTVATYE